jgi:hypothetical protein
MQVSNQLKNQKGQQSKRKTRPLLGTHLLLLEHGDSFKCWDSLHHSHSTNVALDLPLSNNEKILEKIEKLTTKLFNSRIFKFLVSHTDKIEDTVLPHKSS